MKKFGKILVLIMAVSVMQSCEDFLAEEPQGFASSENLLTSEAGIEQALNGVYRAPRSFYWGRNYVMTYGITADDIYFRATKSHRVVMQNFTFTPENSNINRAWTANVTGIARANQIIEAVQSFADGDFKSRIEAEARFLRAWYYFGQVRSYGEVPLITQFEGAELFPSRAPIAEIYAQIVEDLQFAEANLDNWQSVATGRATRGAAKAVLGKVYLTMATTPETADANLFATAASKLKEVIDTEGYGLIDDYKEVFEGKNSYGVESVWSYPGLKDTNYRNAISADFSPNPNLYGIRGYQNFTVFESLRDRIEPTDRRREIMVQGEYEYGVYDIITGALISTETGMTSDGGTAIFTTKYLDPDESRFSENNISTNMAFIRYADVLLMYSEAVNESAGVNAEAYSGIDLVRARSNASVLPRGLSQSELREAIRDERHIEFLGEGMRWFDLIRWGILVEKVLEVKPDAQISWPKHRFFPIPQFEMDANPNLVQNDGYVTE